MGARGRARDDTTLPVGSGASFGGVAGGQEGCRGGSFPVSGSGVGGAIWTTSAIVAALGTKAAATELLLYRGSRSSTFTATTTCVST